MRYGNFTGMEWKKMNESARRVLTQCEKNQSTQTLVKQVCKNLVWSDADLDRLMKHLTRDSIMVAMIGNRAWELRRVVKND
jgi:DNA-directed RNA polymerase delta subunit